MAGTLLGECAGRTELKLIFLVVCARQLPLFIVSLSYFVRRSSSLEICLAETSPVMSEDDSLEFTRASEIW